MSDKLPSWMKPADDEEQAPKGQALPSWMKPADTVPPPDLPVTPKLPSWMKPEGQADPPIYELREQIDTPLIEGGDMANNALFRATAYVGGGEFARGSTEQRLGPISRRQGTYMQLKPGESVVEADRRLRLARAKGEVQSSFTSLMDKEAFRASAERGGGLISRPAMGEDTAWGALREWPFFQFAANVAGGVYGLFGSVVTAPFMGAMVASKEVANAAAAITYRVTADDAELRHARNTLEHGALSSDAELERLAARAKFGATAFVQGLNPAITAAVVAPEGEKGAAVAEALFEYPVESLLPLAALGRKFMTVGGKTQTFHVEIGSTKMPDGTVGPSVNMDVPLRKGSTFQKFKKGRELSDAELAEVRRAAESGVLDVGDGDSGQIRHDVDLSKVVDGAVVTRTIVYPEEFKLNRLGEAAFNLLGLADTGVSKATRGFVKTDTPRVVQWALFDVADPYRTLSATLSEQVKSDIKLDPRFKEVIGEITKIGKRKGDTPITDEFRAKHEEMFGSQYPPDSDQRRAEALSTVDIVRAMEGSFTRHKGGGTYDAKRESGLSVTVQSVVPIGNSKQGRSRIFEHLQESIGLTPDEAKVAVGLMEPMIPRIMELAKRTREAGGKLQDADLEGIPGIVQAMDDAAMLSLAEADPQFRKALSEARYVSGAYAFIASRMEKSLKSMSNKEKQVWKQALLRRIDRTRRGVAWDEYVNLSFESTDALNMTVKYRPISDAELNGRFKRALVAMREYQRSSGDELAELPVSDIGVLEQQTFIEQFKKHLKRMAEVEDLEGQAKVDAISARVLFALRTDWSYRVQSSPESPRTAKVFAELMSDPTSKMSRFRKALVDLQIDIASKMGVDPAIIADSFDSYISRALYDGMLSAEDTFARLGMPGVMGRKSRQEGRFRRRRTDTEWEEQLRDWAIAGEIQAETVLYNTAEQLLLLSGQMRYWDGMWRMLNKSGLASEEYRPGYMKIATTKVAGKDRAASSDPYNFLFGTMAGKYIDPRIARQLKLDEAMLKRAPVVMRIWKLLKTAYNPPGYHMRNHIGDTNNIMSRADLGLSEYRSFFKRGHNMVSRARHGQIVGLDRSKVSPMMKEAIDAGLIDPDAATPRITGDMDNITEAGIRLGDILDRYTPDEDALVEMEKVGSALLHLRLMKTLPERIKGMPKKARDSAQRIIDAAVEVEQKQQEGKIVRTTLWTRGAAALEQVYEELLDTSIARMTRAQEDARRMTAYIIAREKLSMTPAEATRWTLDTLHDYSDKPSWMASMQSGRFTGMIAPPFLTYGYKQPALVMRTAINKHVRFLTMRAMTEGMTSWLEHSYLDSADSRAEDEANRMSLALAQMAALTPAGHHRFFVASARELADALEDVGAPKGFVRATREGDVAYSLSLRDIGNLSNSVLDFDPSGGALRVLARQNPFTRATFTLLDPDLQDPVSFTMVDPARTDGLEWHAHVTSMLASMFVPFFTMAREGKAAFDIVTEASGGKQIARNKRGGRLGTLTAMRPFAQVARVSPLDHVDITMRLLARMRGQKTDLARRHATFIGKIDPSTDEGRRDLQRAKINYAFRTVWTTMRMLEMLKGSGTMRKESQKLREAYTKTMRRFEAGEAVDDDSLWQGNADLRERFYQLYDAAAGTFSDYLRGMDGMGTTEER